MNLHQRFLAVLGPFGGGEFDGCVSHLCLRWSEFDGCVSHLCLRWSEFDGYGSHLALRGGEFDGCVSHLALRWGEFDGCGCHLGLREFDHRRSRLCHGCGCGSYGFQPGRRSTATSLLLALLEGHGYLPIAFEECEQPFDKRPHRGCGAWSTPGGGATHDQFGIVHG